MKKQFEKLNPPVDDFDRFVVTDQDIEDLIKCWKQRGFIKGCWTTAIILISLWLLHFL